MKQLMIIGTDTDVGKTYVSGLILKKLHENGKKAAYFKAAMSGNVRLADGSLLPGDANFVKTISGISQPLADMCPYVYETAVSPHLAAKIEGNPIEWEKIQETYDTLCGTYDFVTVEGSGGIVCPIDFDNSKLQLEDVIGELDLSSILIADAGLGTINGVVLTAEYMRARDLELKGIIFNNFHPGDVMEEDNIRMCEYYTELPTLACVKPGDTALDMSADALAALYSE